MTERSTALEWRRQYEAGATVEQIALDANTYIGKVRRALHSVDTPMRPAHVRKGTQKNLGGNATDGIRGAKTVRVHKTHDLGSNPRPGYRRRGRRT